jgi:hypothetical protein
MCQSDQAFPFYPRLHSLAKIFQCVQRDHCSAWSFRTDHWLILGAKRFRMLIVRDLSENGVEPSGAY